MENVLDFVGCTSVKSARLWEAVVTGKGLSPGARSSLLYLTFSSGILIEV